MTRPLKPRTVLTFATDLLLPNEALRQIWFFDDLILTPDPRAAARQHYFQTTSSILALKQISKVFRSYESLLLTAIFEIIQGFIMQNETKKRTHKCLVDWLRPIKLGFLDGSA